jgi:malate dehydrogenase (oxaloacetate-decarboxylating)(NADP+)
MAFGEDYLIPTPLDTRVLFWEAPAVARAAIESGVARVQIDIDSYRVELENRRQHCERSCKFKDACYPG